MTKSELNVFPEIQISHDFPEINDDEFYKSIQFLKGKNPDYKGFYAANEASNILKYKQLCIISNLLRKNGFNKFMPIKGMYLLNNLFSSFQGIRPMADIDFLVHPDEFKKIPAFLKKHSEIKLTSNFHPALRKFFGEDFSFVWNSTVIELHSKITLVSFPGFIEEVFDKAKEKANPDGMIFLTSDIEYMAAIMLLHDYSRSDFIDLTYRRLLEFYVVLSNCNIEKLTNIVQKYGLEKMFECHLYLIDKMTEKNFLGKEKTNPFHQQANINPDPENKRFTVQNKEKLSKVLYGRKWKKLRARNIVAGIFKKIAGALK